MYGVGVVCCWCVGGYGVVYRVYVNVLRNNIHSGDMSAAKDVTEHSATACTASGT